MKIVIADGFTLNPGDLSWDDFYGLADTEVFQRSGRDELIARCAGADIVLTNKVAFGRAELERLPQLKLIVVTATGYNIIDIRVASEKGVTVCNVPDYGTDSVAQHTFALILELTNQIGMHSRSVRKGDWERSADFSYALSPLSELKDKTLGLVGFGNIGKQTARIAGAFGMKVLYYTPNKKETDLAAYAGLSTIFSESDIISLHLPLRDDNRGFVNKELIALMKESAFLINTARGQLINEQDLADALNGGKIAGAAVDVLSEEPPVSGSPLISARNCIITPHNAWMSFEARQRIMSIAVQNVKCFLEGEPQNVVSYGL